VCVEQAAQTIVALAINQIAISAFFMFPPLKTIVGESPEVAKVYPQVSAAIDLQPP
jgi:hypothetical protein